MSDLSTIARQPGDILSHVISCDDDGAPVLSPFAPDVCENEPFGLVTGRVAIHDAQGQFVCVAKFGWAAREVAKGVLARTGQRTFAQVSA